MNYYLMHNGPIAGEKFDRLPQEAMDTGRWEWRAYHGVYVRDEGSAGGRDWDWEEE